MECDGNKCYPASLAVLLALALSFPGMLGLDSKRLDRQGHIVCDHHSLENSWTRKKGCFTLWLAVGIHSTWQVCYGSLPPAHTACDSDTLWTSMVWSRDL